VWSSDRWAGLVGCSRGLGGGDVGGGGLGGGVEVLLEGWGGCEVVVGVVVEGGEVGDAVGDEFAELLAGFAGPFEGAGVGEVLVEGVEGDGFPGGVGELVEGVA